MGRAMSPFRLHPGFAKQQNAQKCTEATKCVVCAKRSLWPKQHKKGILRRAQVYIIISRFNVQGLTKKRGEADVAFGICCATWRSGKKGRPMVTSSRKKKQSTVGLTNDNRPRGAP